MNARQISGMAALLSCATALAGNVPINNASFESTTGSLSTPLLFPPSSGSLGGWTMNRHGVGALTGLTAPLMSMEHSPYATSGANIAAIRFVAGVLTYGSFSQTLSEGLTQNTRYTVSVDIGDAGIASAIATAGFKITAGGQYVAGTGDAALLSVLDLGPCFDRYTVTFETGDNVLSGNLGIELFAGGLLDAVSGVGFDNIVITADAITGGPTAVPTPLAGALAGSGLMLVGARRRRA